MDNEKKYKALVGKIEKAYLYAQTDSTKAVLEDILPELKESEDEKIRKDIISFLRSKNGYMNPNEDWDFHNRWIPWLEKQGEKPQGKSALEAIKEEKVDNANKVEPKFKVKYAGREYDVFEIKEIAGVTFYEIEDEPNHIDYVLSEDCEIISGYGEKEKGNLYPTKSAIFSEQNSAWSEEDEKIVLSIEQVMNCASLLNLVPEKIERVRAWLKSLKERINK